MEKQERELGSVGARKLRGNTFCIYNKEIRLRLFFGDMQSGFVVAGWWELMLIVFVCRVQFTNAFIGGKAFGRVKPKQ